MNSWYSWRERAIAILDGLGLLALRLWAGQEFATAGYTKLAGGFEAPEWFTSLAFPPLVAWLPAHINWISAGVAEIVFGVALMLGVFSRLSSIALLFITYVAVYTVHFDLGWAGWNQIDTDVGQGFKVPLMLAIMLLITVTQGAGRFALDAWFQRRKQLCITKGAA